MPGIGPQIASKWPPGNSKMVRSPRRRAHFAELDPGASWSHLGASWGHLGASLGPSWSLLGPLGALLGPPWGHLGAILEPSWGLLGATSICGPSWASCGHLGASWGIFRPSWGHLGPSWGHLGAILGPLGAILGHLEAIIPSFMQPTPVRGMPNIYTSVASFATSGGGLVGNREALRINLLHERWPKKASRWPQDCPQKGFCRAPERPQDGLKRPRDGPEKGRRWPKMPSTITPVLPKIAPR